jgi:hypothetical protein
MVIISMLSNRLGILAFALVPTLAGASEFGCPATQSGRQLVSVTLFDGPPGEHADLRPDRYRKGKSGGQSDWNVAYIFEAGRRLHIECQYGSRIPSVVLEAPKVDNCTYYSGRGGGNSLTCK